MVGDQQPLLCVLVAFLVTFLVARYITSRIRAGRGPFSDLALGELHVHHAVWGIGLVLAGGTAEFAFAPDWPLSALPAVGFGVGAALMLDEFGLILYLRDVYWSAEGRRSLDAVIVMTVVLGFLVQLLTPTSRPHWKPVFMVGLIAGWILLMAICLAKGKVFTGLAGLFIPEILIIGAIRLARPDSPWARVFYRRNPQKQRRAAARFRGTRKRERSRQLIVEAIGGSLESPESAARVGA
jgi:hypothetical protein